MRFTLIPIALPLMALGTGACVSASGHGAGGHPSVAMQAASGTLGPAFLEWTGKFHAHQSATGTLGVFGRDAASGTVDLTAPNAEQTTVLLDLEVQESDPVELRWSVAPGDCGTGSIPLMTVYSFPEITLTNGHGHLERTFSMTMPTEGSYHVNVFRSGTVGQDESEVLTCADLTLRERNR
jgi:hypothetical protein